MNVYERTYFALALLTMPLTTGWAYRFFQSIHDEKDRPRKEREDLAGAIGSALLSALLWPFCVPFAFFITGMADHGWGFPAHWPKPASKSAASLPPIDRREV